MTDQQNSALSGDEETTPLDQILFLARAESRVLIIQHLVEWGPTTQRDLRDQLDASRTTVARSLRSLADEGWVKSNDGTYQLTKTGEVIATEFSSMLDTFQVAEKLSDFLQWFPTDSAAPDFLDMSGAEVTSTTEGDPYAPARKQAEILHTADRLRILLPSIDHEATKTITEQVTEHGLEVETIISPELEATIESDEFASLIREKIETGRSTIFVSESTLPFYLGLADDGRVQIGLEDEEGFPRSLLETTDESIREWAEDVYLNYQNEARLKPIE